MTEVDAVDITNQIQHNGYTTMTKFKKTTIAIGIIISVFALSSVFAPSGKADTIAAMLTGDKVAPFVKNASAIIYAPNLTRGTLFQLRGAVGTGWFTRKNGNNNWCDIAPLRILTGDFGGDSIAVSQTEPVVLIAINPDIATLLSQGQDIVTDDYILKNSEPVTGYDFSDIDILVVSAEQETGSFILNPGRNILNDIFGASSTSNACEQNSPHAAIIAE